MNLTEYPREVVLTGCYHCSLTDTQRNAWTEYITNRKEYVDFCRVDSLGKKAVHSGSPEEMARLSRDFIDHSKIMFSIAKRWHEALPKDEDDE